MIDPLVKKPPDTSTSCAVTDAKLSAASRTPEFTIAFRTIAKGLFWGFIEKQTRYSKYRIAEAEKALLDWIYLSLQAGLIPPLDEIDLKTVDKQKLVTYADKYPGTVRTALMRSLAFEHFAAGAQHRTGLRERRAP